MAAPASDPKLHILVMAGGTGTRFWPRSRAGRPKQLLALWDEKTLLEHTLERFLGVVDASRIWVVTTAALVEPSKQVLPPEKYGSVKFLGEPSGKNTAPCILWGASEILRADTDATVAVMPADHFIRDEKAFIGTVRGAVEFARVKGGLVTLGVRPNRPETGYGYIEVAEAVRSSAVPVQQFVEKPDVRTAVSYLQSGRYLWNAGMFVFTAKQGLAAFEKCMPGLMKTFRASQSGPAGAYGSISKDDAISFDYGVMERAGAQGIPVSVIPLDCGWNDVGAFPALEEIECAVRGEVVSLDAASNVVQTDEGLVALLGVNDLVVVRDRDVVLVASKDRAQDIKALLEKVRRAHPEKL